MKSTKHLSGSSRPFLLLLLNSIFIAIISIALGAVSINALGLCAAWSWFQKLLFAAFTGGAYFVYSLVIVGLLFLLLKLFRLNSDGGSTIRFFSYRIPCRRYICLSDVPDPSESGDASNDLPWRGKNCELFSSDDR